ncbi:MAG: flagellar hook-length control protein FliK [Variovorax sp.]|nr:MAG: flagellar hook-length control protein FliK [Variovorax sp.]
MNPSIAREGASLPGVIAPANRREGGPSTREGGDDAGERSFGTALSEADRHAEATPTAQPPKSEASREPSGRAPRPERAGDADGRPNDPFRQRTKAVDRTGAAAAAEAADGKDPVEVSTDPTFGMPTASGPGKDVLSDDASNPSAAAAAAAAAASADLSLLLAQSMLPPAAAVAPAGTSDRGMPAGAQAAIAVAGGAIAAVAGPTGAAGAARPGAASAPAIAGIAPAAGPDAAGSPADAVGADTESVARRAAASLQAASTRPARGPAEVESARTAAADAVARSIEAGVTTGDAAMPRELASTIEIRSGANLPSNQGAPSSGPLAGLGAALDRGLTTDASITSARTPSWLVRTQLAADRAQAVASAAGAERADAASSPVANWREALGTAERFASPATASAASSMATAGFGAGVSGPAAPGAERGPVRAAGETGAARTDGGFAAAPSASGPLGFDNPAAPSTADRGTPLAERIADQVSWWVSQKNSSADFTLDMRDGQPVSVNVQVQGNEAQVSFRSDQADVRAALGEAMSQLQDLLGAQGLTLSGSSVGSHGQAQQQAASDGQGQPAAGMSRGTDGVARSTAGAEPARSAGAGPRAPSGRGLDLYV